MYNTKPSLTLTIVLKHQPLARISSATTSWSDVMVLLLGLLVLIHGLDGYGLYEPHEGHFGGVAREMLLRGDWITPHLNGSPYLNKPPLLPSSSLCHRFPGSA
ncbi:hypothetical protein [Moorena sp. SIOASIH]|uniref:ArnT family glycosyltransferase n=1 Tax=Moorena sp. SIOASIH TaxID=2607817 RepID=UPI0025E3FC12|nr:hypothetical protein [Moorena sp. SIOASIH]